MAKPTTLVIGGTGVTGIALVDGLLKRGHDVTVLHSGRHKPDQSLAPWYYDNSVKILKGNAFNEKKLLATLGGPGGYYYDNVFSNYGNLRVISKLFSGDNPRLCQRFFSVGGIPIYQMYGDAPESNVTVGGVAVGPMEESHPVCSKDGTLRSEPLSHNPKLNQMVLAEQAVFHYHPTATHVRYPLMYGPYQIIPKEWLVVKRILDKRKFIILPGSGHSLVPRCSSLNGANMLLYCLDHPKESAGEIFNAQDEATLTASQWVHVIAKALNSDISIVTMPLELAAPARPLGFELSTSLSLKKAYKKLDYSDHEPAVEALTRTAQWLAKNGVDTITETLLQDPFDYENEDRLLECWQKGDVEGCKRIVWEKEPGFGHFYYGKEHNPYDRLSQEERHEGTWDPQAVKRVKVNFKKSKL